MGQGRVTEFILLLYCTCSFCTAHAVSAQHSAGASYGTTGSLYQLVLLGPLGPSLRFPKRSTHLLNAMPDGSADVLIKPLGAHVNEPHDARNAQERTLNERLRGSDNRQCRCSSGMGKLS